MFSSLSPRGARVGANAKGVREKRDLEPERIELASYEIVVDMYDFSWGFYLQRVDGAADDESGRRQRHWHFRAPTEALRLAWTEKLIGAIRWAQSPAGEQARMANNDEVHQTAPFAITRAASSPAPSGTSA